MMCGDSNSSCENRSDECSYIYRFKLYYDHLRLLIAIVIRMVLSVVISSNKTERHGEGTHIEQRKTCTK